LVEEEQWTQIDVPYSVQHIANTLIKSAIEDPAECQILPPPPGTTRPSETVTEKEETTKTLSIEAKEFFVVKATSESLVLLAEYLTVVINLELVVMDVMSRIIEFLKVRFGCAPEAERSAKCSPSTREHVKLCLELERCGQLVSRILPLNILVRL
jgi:hypothetical protein